MAVSVLEKTAHRGPTRASRQGAYKDPREGPRGRAFTSEEMCSVTLYWGIIYRMRIQHYQINPCIFILSLVKVVTNVISYCFLEAVSQTNISYWMHPAT